METTAIVLIMLLAVVVSGFAARLVRLPLPLVQIAIGALIDQSGLEPARLEPEVFFLLFLPPLLFLDGWRLPKDDLLRNARSILRLALGLVVFTVIGIGLLIHWLMPAMPLAVAFALAAVISPTDPIAVAAIPSRTPMPTRMLHILRGEALFNDASGLVCMRFAVAAALTGTFALHEAVSTFVWVAAGGLAIGTAVTWLVTRAESWSADRLGSGSGSGNPGAASGNDAGGGAQILVTVLIPFGVYLLAERLGCSGILAAVAAGITMSFIPHSHWRATTRIHRTAVWDTVQFAANGSIFVLLGEEIPAIAAAATQTVQATGHQSPWWLALYVVVLVAALAALRFVWVWASMRSAFLGAPSGAPASSYARLVLAMSLAGVRGAITLAAVMTLPLRALDGSPFPGRDLAIFLAAGVIVLSLLLATIALPRSLRGLNVPPDPTRRALEDRVRTAGAEAAVRAIDTTRQALAKGSADADLYTDASTGLVERYRRRVDRYVGDDAASKRRDKSEGIERSLRLAGLRAERDEIVRIGRHHGIDDTTLRKLVREIDLQEARYSA